MADSYKQTPNTKNASFYAADADGKNEAKKYYTSFFPILEAGKPYETVEIIEHNVVARDKAFTLSIGIERDPRAAQPRPQQIPQQPVQRTVPLAPVQQETLPGTEDLIWR